MHLFFNKNTQAFLEAANFSTACPAANPNYYEANKARFKELYGVDSLEDMIEVIVDETEDKEAKGKFLAGYVPKIDLAGKEVENTEQEYEEETEEYEEMDEEGIPVKKIRNIKGARKIFNKNKHLLKPTQDWEKSVDLIREEEEQARKEANKTRMDEIENELKKEKTLEEKVNLLIEQNSLLRK